MMIAAPNCPVRFPYLGVIPYHGRHSAHLGLSDGNFFKTVRKWPGFVRFCAGYYLTARFSPLVGEYLKKMEFCIDFVQFRAGPLRD